MELADGLDIGREGEKNQGGCIRQLLPCNKAPPYSRAYNNKHLLLQLMLLWLGNGLAGPR